jgi:hypothetical protein
MIIRNCIFAFVILGLIYAVTHLTYSVGVNKGLDACSEIIDP